MYTQSNAQQMLCPHNGSICTLALNSQARPWQSKRAQSFQAEMAHICLCKASLGQLRQLVISNEKILTDILRDRKNELGQRVMKVEYVYELPKNDPIRCEYIYRSQFLSRVKEQMDKVLQRVKGAETKEKSSLSQWLSK